MKNNSSREPRQSELRDYSYTRGPVHELVYEWSASAWPMIWTHQGHLTLS